MISQGPAPAGRPVGTKVLESDLAAPSGCGSFYRPELRYAAPRCCRCCCCRCSSCACSTACKRCCCVRLHALQPVIILCAIPDALPLRFWLPPMPCLCCSDLLVRRAAVFAGSLLYRALIPLKLRSPPDPGELKMKMRVSGVSLSQI
ncbi:hypothetical protein BDZ91DRAFT_713791 [Kalaharituber pfeilii]|nr:hypothetical protein BDZ91DRAFT_713791 [Kalaharituber pfeilii]